MDNLADKQIRAARILFNLAHCYLQTTDIDEEQEKKNEDSEKDRAIKKDIQQTKKEEINEKDDDKLEKKKLELDNEIELYLQVQVDSKYQQQLNTDVQNKGLKKTQKPEIEIELKIEIPQKLDNSYLKTVEKNKQHVEEDVKKTSKKKNEFSQNKQRVNKQELIYREKNADSEFQGVTEKEIKLEQHLSQDNIPVDSDEKNINCYTTQKQIQKRIEIKSQGNDNNEILLERELQEQRNLHGNLIETFDRSIQKRIERLIFEIPLKNQKIDKELRQEIEELNREIKELDPENFNELNKEILEEVSKKDYLPVQVKFLKNLYLSFTQDLTPFYNRLDQLSNDKTQTAVQQKLNEEFLKKLDSLVQQKCNEEVCEGHQQVDSKIKQVVNKDVKMAKENKKLKRTDELHVNHEIENNGNIKEKELQQNILKVTQERVNGDEKIRNKFEEISEKEKYQNYDLVIQYNHEMSQELKGKAQQVIGKKILVDFYDDAMKTYINQADKVAIIEKLRKAGTDVINPTQKEGNKNIDFKLEFYKHVHVEEELQEKNEEQLKNYTEEEINGDPKEKIKENETDIKENSDVEIEDFEEEIQEYSKIENDDNFEEIYENSKIEDPEKEEEEDDSDVDIEGFEGELVEFPEVQIEDFDEESPESTDVDTEDLSEEGFNDINEVVEIVEDIEVESDSSIDNGIPLDKTTTTTCNVPNFKIDPNSKLTHDEEEKLKIINSSDSKILTDHIKEKQTFFELEHKLDELSQEYKGYVQQKVFEELQQEIDDKQLQEMETFPDTFNEANLNIKEDFQKEIDELQSEWCQLKPEFMSDVPLSFEEENSSKKLKEKPFNLFDRLFYIHRKLLCKFANSKEWPENCFQPSSLLDVLFDDPTEFKPNVLLIILHSIDKGYSIKINTDKNSNSPKEYCFNYCEDRIILEHMENEHLPPELLDLLDSAEPRLFYSGCVIAEFHDQIDEVPGRVYRILLRPFSMSIQSDVDRIIAKNSHPTNTNYWSYNKRLKLESILLKKSYPVMCMDSSPIAGLVVNLQHQVLSCRTIVLNPLRRKHNCSKAEPLKTDLYNESNENLNTSMFSNKPQEESSKCMDTENTNIDNYIIWKFVFRIKSLNLFKMFVMVITETLELSILLCTNPMVDSIKKMRFKIQLEQNELKAFIIIMLEILRQKISPDIEVVRRYKCQENSTPLSLRSVPSPMNDNVYKASHGDISQLIDIFINASHIKYIPINEILEKNSEHKNQVTKFESKKSELSFMQEKMAVDTQKTEETKENSIDPEIKKSMQFCKTKKLSSNSKKFLDVSKMDFKDKIADLSSSITQTIPRDIFFDDTMPLFKEKMANTETNSSFEPSLIRPIYVVSENDNSSDLDQEKIQSVANSSMIQTFGFPIPTIPFESSPAVVLSSLSTINSLVTSIKTYMLPIESSSLGYIANSDTLPLQTDENLLTSTFNDNDDIHANIELLPAMQPDDLIHLTKIDDIAVNMFYYINQITPTSCNGMMSPTENIFTMFSKSDYTEGREILEDKYMLRCLQLFHQKPTLPDISILPKTQGNEEEISDI